MTTPANRAPRFVVIDEAGDGDLFFTESAACANAGARDTIHPIGPALPAKVAEKTLGQVAYETMPDCVKLGMFRPSQVEWDRAASAVIAAHEASVLQHECRTVTRWAVRRGDQWSTGINWGAKEFRTLYATRDCAAYGRVSRDEKLVKVTSTLRRRRVAK